MTAWRKKKKTIEGVLGAIAAPIAAHVADQLLSDVIGKVFGGKKQRKLKFRQRRR